VVTLALVIPLLILAAMLAHDWRQNARMSRHRKSKAGGKWRKLAVELRSNPTPAPRSDVRHVRRGEVRTFGFFRPEIKP
jgi:hypothetical protein